MKAKIVQIKGLKFEGTMENGARTLFHVPDKGEEPEAPSPMGHVVLGLAGCTALDVVEILAKMRQKLRKLEVDIDYERAKKNPRVLTTVHLHFLARGLGLSEKKLARAIALSQEKYCSVSAMLRKGGVRISWDHQVAAT